MSQNTSHAVMAQRAEPNDHSKEVFLGAPFIVDKTLAPAQFDVAFTQAGWQRLLDRAR